MPASHFQAQRQASPLGPRCVTVQMLDGVGGRCTGELRVCGEAGGSSSLRYSLNTVSRGPVKIRPEEKAVTRDSLGPAPFLSHGRQGAGPG